MKHNYHLHGQILEAVPNAKNFGNKTLGFIKRNITTKNENVKELAYTTLIRPQVEYISSIWSSYTKTNTNKVEMVQRRAARWVKRDYSPFASIMAMQEDLGWWTLEHRS